MGGIEEDIYMRSHADFVHILSKESRFVGIDDGYNPGKEIFDYLRGDCRILVIGAGGLGCEIIKDLVLSGFQSLDIIDMDKVDITNLNRQFLFRKNDVGKYKSEVAARVINDRCKHLGVKVFSHVGKIQEKEASFYKQFNLIIAGLDNIPARRWINSLLFNLVETNKNGDVDMSTVIPLLDGGTEGFKGQARVILPTITSCFDCTLETFPPQVNFPLCTIAETPRLPEHCIEYGLLILWEKAFPNRKFDNDSSTDVTWLYERALERAECFGILGVTYHLTLGVVKRIIPAIASTNALISAALVLECIKLSTYGGPVLNDYMMYTGSEGVYTNTFQYEKNANCLVCGGKELIEEVDIFSTTLQDLLEVLRKNPRYQLSLPSISSASKVIFMQHPPVIRELHEYKLKLPLSKIMRHKNYLGSVEGEGGESENLFEEMEPLVVTDPVLPSKLILRIKVASS